MDKIKPCPICGRDPTFHPALDMGDNRAINPYIVCLACSLRLTGPVRCLCPSAGFGDDTSEEALEWSNETLICRWNSMPRRRRRRGETVAET